MNHQHGEISPLEGELFHQPSKKLLIQQAQENVFPLVDYVTEEMENTHSTHALYFTSYLKYFPFYLSAGDWDLPA